MAGRVVALAHRFGTSLGDGLGSGQCPTNVVNYSSTRGILMFQALDQGRHVRRRRAFERQARPVHGMVEAKFGGMEVSEAKKLKALEAENAKLKKLVADLSLDKLALQDLLSKNW